MYKNVKGRFTEDYQRGEEKNALLSLYFYTVDFNRTYIMLGNDKETRYIIHLKRQQIIMFLGKDADDLRNKMLKK